MQHVRRFDSSTFGKPQRTPQGFMRIPAYLTRAGIFEYRRHDGTVVRELRPADEVFKAASLATLAAAPVTDLHPLERKVTPANVRQVSVGHVSEEVRREGDFIAAHVTVQDGQMIAAIERGDRHELSCGYDCRSDPTPGMFEGRPYDAVQRDIVYNHVALGPRNWGRAGSSVALHLDSGDAMSADAMQAPPERQSGDQTMDLVTIRIDGVDVEVSKQAAQLLERALTTGMDKLVQDRLTLIEQARTVLPAGFKFEGKSTREVHDAAIKAIDPTFYPGDKSDDYVRAFFTAAMGSRAKPAARADAAPPVVTPFGAPPVLRDARGNVIAGVGGYIPDHMRPTSVSKETLEHGSGMQDWQRPLSRSRNGA